MTTFISPIYGKTFVLHVHFEIVFQKIPSNITYFSNLGRNCKLRNDQTPALLCNYFPNESSGLHEILCSGQFLPCELKFEMSWRFVNNRARTSCKRAHTCFTHLLLMSAHICPLTVIRRVIDHHIKFYEDPSFHWGDICKNNINFLKTLIFNVFSLFSQFYTSKVFQSG